MFRFVLLLVLVQLFSIFLPGRADAQAYRLDRPQDARAVELANAGRHGEAEALLRRILEDDRQRLGPTHPNTVDTMENLAVILDLQRRYGEAEPLHRLTATVRSENLGPDAPATLRAMSNLGTTLKDLNRPGEAISILESALSGSEKTFGMEAIETLRVLNELGAAHLVAGDYQNAELVLSRAVTTGQRALGQDHPSVLTWSINLARAWGDQGRYEESNALNRQVIDRLGRLHGPTSPNVLAAKNNLAFGLMTQGRLIPSEILFRELLEVREGSLGPAHPGTMTARLLLGNTLARMGRGDEALALRGRDLSLASQAYGPEHGYTLRAMGHYASALERVGQDGEAQDVRERRLAVSQRVLGNMHEATLIAMNDLATGYLASNERLGRAQSLIEQSHAGFARLFGPGHPRSINAAINLGSIWGDTGQLDAAITLLRETDQILEGANASRPEERIRLSFALSSVLQDAGRPNEAVVALARRLDDADALYGERSVRPYQLRARLAGSMVASGAAAEALPFARVAHAGLYSRLQRTGDLSADRQRVALNDASSAAWTLISAAWQASLNADETQAEHLAAEAFEAAQTIGLGPSAFAISRASGRIAADSSGASTFLKRWTEAKLDLAAFETKLISAASGPTGLSASSTEALERLTQRLADATTELQSSFPEFFDLINPSVIPTDDLLEGGRFALDDDEALVLLVSQVSDDKSIAAGPGFVWAVTREKVTWARLTLPTSSIESRVSALRQSINPEEGLILASRAPMASLSEETNQRSSAPFDGSLAHEIYQSLFGNPDIADAIADKERWIIAPQGPLLSLPFGALVVAPQKAFATQAETLRRTEWLGTKRSLRVLPSLQLLIASNDRSSAPSEAGVSYVGFGDPAFQGTNGPLHLTEETTVAKLRSNVAGLRGLPRLPQTRTEVLTLADHFQPARSEVFLGEAASEFELQNINQNGRLSQARILHFATHGLISGDFEELEEPALALSPVNQSSGEFGDGLLTASEAATLSLDAEWVLLSACNTAAGSGAGAEGMSGLARAFFYAGAQNMLVTHWPIRDDLAARLIIDVVAPEVSISKGEALRLAIADLVQDPSEDHRDVSLAHPRNWASFLIVGYDRKPLD